MSPYRLLVNGVSLETAAWFAPTGGYDDLLASPAVRGTDRVMPGARGVRSYRRIATATPVSVSLIVTGECDPNGTPYDLPRIEGLLTNRDLLRHELGLSIDQVTRDGLVPARFERGSLPAWEGEVTVVGLADWQTLSEDTGAVRLDLLIPAGELVEVSP